MTKTILRVSPIRYIGAKVRPHATPWMPLYCVDLVLAKKKKKKKKRMKLQTMQAHANEKSALATHVLATW